MVIEQIIQNGDIPTLSPKMRGPKSSHQTAVTQK